MDDFGRWTGVMVGLIDNGEEFLIGLTTPTGITTIKTSQAMCLVDQLITMLEGLDVIDGEDDDDGTEELVH